MSVAISEPVKMLRAVRATSSAVTARRRASSLSGLSQCISAAARRRAPQPLLLMAWPMAGYAQPGYTEADIITDLLSAGRAARLHRNVMARYPDLLCDAEASIMGSEHEGMLMMDCRIIPYDDESIMRARDCLLAEALALTDPASISSRELERAVRRFEARYAAEEMSPLSMARRLAAAEMHCESSPLRWPDAARAVPRCLSPCVRSASCGRLWHSLWR